GVMNVATYGSTLLAARLLGPQAYGGFAAVSGLLLVVGVVMLGLQTTGARRVAATPEHVGEIERALMRVTYLSSWVLAGGCLLLTPVFDRVLNLQSTATAAIVALVVWPMTTVGGAAGILQGERRWVPLAGVYLSMGVARLAGTMLLLWRPEEWVAALSMAIGFGAPALIGWVALRRTSHLRSPHASGHHDERAILRELAANSHALLAFFALSNADVILSRMVLDPHSSGLYAGGSIMVKSLLFLPQFVIVVAFPSLSTEAARRETLVKSVALLLALGALVVVGVWAFSGLALVFIGGHQYAAIQDQLWIFAVLGTVLSTVQLLVYSVVARQSRRTVYLIWAALVVLAIAVTRAQTAAQMVVIVTVVDSVLMSVLLVLSWWRLRHDDPEAAAAAAEARTKTP
ncbi:MAG: polysaccharide biosynthesis protein, partial [Marmoricola sp.]|nr:polysaccharide biosynthesis protein [Marmoricola sp.]